MDARTVEARLVESRSVRVLALALMATLGLVSAGRGQVVAPPIGSRVRITAPGAGLEDAVGTLRAVGDSTLVLDLFVDASTARLDTEVNHSTITKFEVSNGKRGRALKGMWIGALVGGGSGAILMINPPEECANDLVLPCEGPSMVLQGAVGGAIWGLIIGALIKTERWSPVARSEIGFSIVPTVGERGVGLRFALRRGR